MLNSKTIAFLGLAAIGLSACGDAQGVASQDAGPFFAEQMKANASRMKSHFRAGVKLCLERKAGGKIPSYVVSYVTEGGMIVLRYISSNNEKKHPSEHLKAIEESIERQLTPKASRVVRRVMKEKSGTRQRATKILEMGEANHQKIGKCALDIAKASLEKADQG